MKNRHRFGDHILGGIKLQHRACSLDIRRRQPLLSVVGPQDHHRPLLVAGPVHVPHDRVLVGVHGDHRHRHRVPLGAVRILKRAPDASDAERPPAGQPNPIPDMLPRLLGRRRRRAEPIDIPFGYSRQQTASLPPRASCRDIRPGRVQANSYRSPTFMPANG